MPDLEIAVGQHAAPVRTDQRHVLDIDGPARALDGEREETQSRGEPFAAGKFQPVQVGRHALPVRLRVDRQVPRAAGVAVDQMLLANLDVNLNVGMGAQLEYRGIDSWRRRHALRNAKQVTPARRVARTGQRKIVTAVVALYREAAWERAVGERMKRIIRRKAAKAPPEPPIAAGFEHGDAAFPMTHSCLGVSKRYRRDAFVHVRAAVKRSGRGP